MLWFTLGILLSIFYLYQISQYNLCSFNTIRTSTNWFLHPSNGGVCVFGQIMALLTSILLFIMIATVLYTNKIHYLIVIILYILSLLWIVGSCIMNNNWLGIRCIPLAIVWILITFI